MDEFSRLGPGSIALFLPDTDGGGAQRTMINLAHAMSDDGLTVVLIVGRAGGAAEAWIPKSLSRLDLQRQRLRDMFFPLRRALLRLRPSIFMSTMLDANVLSWFAWRSLPKPRPALVLRETNSQRARTDLSPLRRRLAEFCYARAGAVVALSSGVGRELSEDCQLPENRLAVLPNPVTLDLGSANRPEEMPEGRVVVASGRLHPQKGFDLLIKAFSELPENDVSLAILGEGPEREALEGQIAESGLVDRVLMPGFVDNPNAWFSHATCFVLSSRWEGFGHVVVEAMAAGCPVLAVDCPHGPRDILTGPDDGILLPDNRPETLSQGMRSLLIDKQLQARLSEGGKKRAAAFSSKAVSHGYRTLFHSLDSAVPL